MDFTSIIALLGGISTLLILILRFKLPAFIALLIATLIIGLLLGMEPNDIFKTVEKGMGGTLGYVATIVGLGAMFGSLLEVTGSAEAIARHLLHRFGLEKASWTLLLSGFFIAIPVFFDVAFVLLIPIVYFLQKQTNKSLLYYALPLLAGLAVTHAFIPPTPGPVAVAKILGADLGRVIVLGLIAGLPAAIVSGILFGKYIAGKIFVKTPDYFVDKKEDHPLPSIGGVFFIVLLPITLIVLRAFVDADFADFPQFFKRFIGFIGHPFSALILANLIAWYFLGIRGNFHKKELFKVASKSMEPAGTIILLTGAGGVLKQLLIDSELGLDLAKQFTRFDVSIYLVAFGIAALIRVLQGSSTVAMITAAGIIAPLAMASSQSPFSLALITIAIGSGASIFSHVNDSGFWLVSQYLGMDETKTFKSWTMMTTILGVTGLLMVMLLSLWV